MNELEQLERDHAAAKSRMIRGIVFVVIATVLFSVVSALASAMELASSSDITMLVVIAALVIVGLVFYAIGIPSLITGIIRTAKTNNQINQIKNQQQNNYQGF